MFQEMVGKESFFSSHSDVNLRPSANHSPIMIYFLHTDVRM